MCPLVSTAMVSVVVMSDDVVLVVRVSASVLVSLFLLFLLHLTYIPMMKRRARVSRIERNHVRHILAH